VTTVSRGSADRGGGGESRGSGARRERRGEGGGRPEGRRLDGGCTQSAGRGGGERATSVADGWIGMARGWTGERFRGGWERERGRGALYIKRLHIKS